MRDDNPAPATSLPGVLPWGPNAASSDSVYRAWLVGHRSAAAQSEDDPPSGTLLHVVLSGPPGPASQLRGLLRSLIEQRHRSWRAWIGPQIATDPASRSTLGEFRGEARIAQDPLPDAMADPTGSAVADRLVGGFAAAPHRLGILEPYALGRVAAAVDADRDIDIVYGDEGDLDSDGSPLRPILKPEWDEDLLLSTPYLGVMTWYRTDLLRGMVVPSGHALHLHDYDLMLRATERARGVHHVPLILFHTAWAHDDRPGSLPTVDGAAADRSALEGSCVRRSIDCTLRSGEEARTFHHQRVVHERRAISVIIPFRDQAPLTAACVASLDRTIDRGHVELVLVDNGSTEPETIALIKRLRGRPDVTVLDSPGPFNWSKINNEAVSSCSGELVLFLNNDVEAVSPGWLDAMVEHAEAPQVGAVGARLLYPDGRVQHAGIVIGFGGPAGHIFAGLPPGERGYGSWDRLVRQYCAVTAACMLIDRTVFDEIGGFDEQLPIAFNDIDLCLRLRERGYRNIFTPHAELVHHESMSRGLSGYSQDVARFLEIWGDVVRSDDPFYSPNLGRFDPWCPLRQPGENEQFTALIDRLIPARP